MMFIGFFEPETLGETLINEQDAITQVEEAKLLEQRFASIAQRISDIEETRLGVVHTH